MNATQLTNQPAGETRELARWSKLSPTIDGVYWWRADASDHDPDIHHVQGEFFYQVGFASSEAVMNFGGEWLGPITPALTDEVARLREALKGLGWEYPNQANGYCWCDAKLTWPRKHSPACQAARAALQPKAEGEQKQ